MYFRSFLFLALACLVYTSEASDIRKVLPQARAILQKFLSIVEDNQLNVSIVTSHAQYWSNGEVQQLADSALLLPPNNVVLTKSQLTSHVGNQWLSDLASWTSHGSGIATYRVVGFLDLNFMENSSNLYGVPMSQSLENILRPVHSDETELIEDDEDFKITYNYVIKGDNYVNLTNILAVNLNIVILENSPNMPLTKINVMKVILSKIWMMMGKSHLLVQYLEEALNARIPLTNSTWKVLIGTPEFYIPNGQWVKLGIFDTNVVIFALDS